MSSPVAVQLPGAVHEIDSAPSAFVDPIADGSFTSLAVPHVPPSSFTTKPCTSLALSVYSPAAPQFPAELHDTDHTVASPPALSAPVPGTSMAVPHVPPVSSTTKACECVPASVKLPPALQLPAELHEIEYTPALRPTLRVAVPGTSLALSHVPGATSRGASEVARCSSAPVLDVTVAAAVVA